MRFLLKIDAGRFDLLLSGPHAQLRLSLRLNASFLAIVAMIAGLWPR
jgi:hypothetical protein